MDKEELPTSIAGFGYEFTTKGELRNKTNGERFVFEVRPGDKAYNQRHYEALGKCVTEHVYHLLVTECALTRAKVPHGLAEGEPASCVFHSEDLFTNPSKLLVLIQGGGVVRAGQWARRLIINDSLDTGSQIPYIERAVAGGFAVIVLNPNENTGLDLDGKEVKISRNASANEHVQYVWDTLICESPAEAVFIVAHSAGGDMVKSLVQNDSSARSRIAKIALTDASLQTAGMDEALAGWFLRRTTNWVTSQKELGDDLTKPGDHNVQTKSAGVKVHEETTQAVIHEVFNFFSKPCILEDP